MATLPLPGGDAVPPAGGTASTTASDGVVVERTDAVVVPVIAEQLSVDKRLVDSGAAVRLRKLVHEDVVTVDEPLTDEVVEVERVPVGRPVDAPVAVRYEGDVMIVGVVEERLVVTRQLVLVEELRVSRRRQVRSEPQTVTLRREEVVAERFDPASGEWRPIEPPTPGPDAA